jgi:hypothetical protein
MTLKLHDKDNGANQKTLCPPQKAGREDLVKTHCPLIRVVPKCNICHGLSNETSLEKIGRGLFFL